MSTATAQLRGNYTSQRLRPSFCLFVRIVNCGICESELIRSPILVAEVPVRSRIVREFLNFRIPFQVTLRPKSYLERDPKVEKFTHNPAANRYLSYQYRAPYK